MYSIFQMYSKKRQNKSKYRNTNREGKNALNVTKCVNIPIFFRMCTSQFDNSIKSVYGIHFRFKLSI